MSTTLARSAGRTTDKVAPVATLGYAAIGVFGVVVALQDPRDPSSRVFWLLAAFCALGLVAMVLAWASVRAGRGLWNAAVAVALVSLAVLVWGITGPNGLALLGMGIAFVFIDWVVLATAHRAISAP
ncbi:hypothetical protein [Nocardioides sp.]|uniref:hypothetical protein n=1 Tax=Nocardioides sp. TaxID=35761 RepID=UPI003783506F